jgi:uncharacterized flavoprotein (TIGR03862 family)
MLPSSFSQAAIIGSGPAGLTAAEVLSASGIHVTVIERMPSVARKLLMAGRSGLNLTHSETPERFISRYGEAASWLSPALATCSATDVVAWAEELGQPCFTGSSGRIFPRAMKASPLVRAWMTRLEQQGVKLRTRTEWKGFTPDGSLRLQTNGDAEDVLKADIVILATGGGSWPRLGSNGKWVEILEAEGLPIAPLRPANCGFSVNWSESFRERFAGTPLKNARFTVASTGHSSRGEAVITDRGIEGGAIYALSAMLRDIIARDGKALLLIDLRPDLTKEQIIARLSDVRARESLGNRLRKALRMPSFTSPLLRESGQHASTPQDIASLLKAFPIVLTEPDQLDRAISTAGGLKSEALDENFMIRSRPGIFACGEMLDWEAPTGGYLLQACFATGHAAATGALRWLQSSTRTLYCPSHDIPGSSP